MNRFHASLLVLALWAAIFLPGLGSTEIKGEEGRRILPAVTMLQTGNWLVPYVGGKPFLRKPPLVNWAIAGAFKLTGVQNEWSARLPSVLSLLVLALAIAGLGTGKGWMSAETALVAAILTLTQAAVLDKGRLAEIEAVYVALTGLGILFWLAWWTQGRSPWLTWTVPFAFMGLALLAKGPLPNLLFFYATIGCVLWQAREMKALRHPAHFLGIALMLGIFLLWLIPYRHNEATLHAADVWKHQMASRVAGKFDLAGWLTNIPRGLSDHLPWLLFAPLLWRQGLEKLEPRPLAAFRGTRLALLACFFGLLIIPSVLPRYTMPLGVPFALLLATALADPRLDPPKTALRAWWRTNQMTALTLILAACAAPVFVAISQRAAILAVPGGGLWNFMSLLIWPLFGSGVAVVLCLAVYMGRWKMARPALIAASSGALVAAGMALYASAGIPFVNRSNVLVPMAASIDASVGANQTLYIYDSDYQPAIFYLHVPVAYALQKSDVSPDAQWLLVSLGKRGRAGEDWPGFEEAHEFSPGRLQKVVLLHRIAH